LLDLIHTDLWGPSPVAFNGNARYYVTLIDDFSKKSLGILLEAEIRSILEIQEVKNVGEKSDGAKVKVLRPDNGDEYTSKKFKDYLASKGIKHQLNISG